ncbi:MAG: class I SAM-dependent methyltransferase [Gemmatimonadota bacterium]
MAENKIGVSEKMLDKQLTAKIEPFDSFWEAPENVEKGYPSWGKFYEYNYLRYVPPARDARILVISCGPGYFVNLLVGKGYTSVVGIDSAPEKVEQARRRGLDCRVARVFGFLQRSDQPYDAIIAEQEINHLTKPEILEFLRTCREKLVEGGTLIVHSINGASPLTGSESRAGNFDHYNSFTEYSLKQVLEYAGFREVKVFPLNLYIYFHNPLNYVAMLIAKLNSLFFRLNFILVGKTAKMFTKKIGAVGRK